MEHFCKHDDKLRRMFGDLMVVGFFIAQCLDGILTYLGITLWGAGIEANPLIHAAIATAGLTGGLAGAKLAAIAFGMLLHLRRAHSVVALLTAFYVVVAILPWAILLAQ